MRSAEPPLVALTASLIVVVAVAEAERVGVVAEPAVERVDTGVEARIREIDDEVVDADDVVGAVVVGATDHEADRRISGERPVQRDVGVCRCWSSGRCTWIVWNGAGAVRRELNRDDLAGIEAIFVEVVADAGAGHAGKVEHALDGCACRCQCHCRRRGTAANCCCCCRSGSGPGTRCWCCRCRRPRSRTMPSAVATGAVVQGLVVEVVGIVRSIATGVAGQHSLPCRR